MRYYRRTMTPSKLAGISVGVKYPVRIMGVINVSPESFYKRSVPRNERSLALISQQMQKDGADFIDVGAMSSAPYLKTQIPEWEEARRLEWAVRIIRKNSALPISIDCFRSGPAAAGLGAGGKILNDITGLRGDPRMGRVAKYARGVILMANPIAILKKIKSPILTVKYILQHALSVARENSIPLSHIVLDPGIGFFRNEKISWVKWDLQVLRDLEKLRGLSAPILVGVSRKSFIGKITGKKNPEDRLAESLAATTIAVMNGALIIRTHDVKATRDAVRVVERIRDS